MSGTVRHLRPQPSTPVYPGDAAWIRLQLETGFQWAVISAHRAGLNPRENNARSAALWADLAYGVRRYSPIPVAGTYAGVAEESWLAFGLPETQALDFARQYGQESILTPRGLVYVDGTGVAPLIGWKWGEVDPDNSSRVFIPSTGETVAFSAVLDFGNVH